MFPLHEVPVDPPEEGLAADPPGGTLGRPQPERRVLHQQLGGQKSDSCHSIDQAEANQLRPAAQH